MNDTRALRTAFGRFATGVTVITATAPDGESAGLTANSFSSVSLDPPLLLWCLGKASDCLPVFSRAEHFVINILAESQRDVAQCFATKLIDRFAQVSWRAGTCGAPRIDDCVAWFECRVAARHDAGDHIIVVGEVEHFGHNEDKPPLLFYAGRYGRADRHPGDA